MPWPTPSYAPSSHTTDLPKEAHPHVFYAEPLPKPVVALPVSRSTTTKPDASDGARKRSRVV